MVHAEYLLIVLCEEINIAVTAGLHTVGVRVS